MQLNSHFVMLKILKTSKNKPREQALTWNLVRSVTGVQVSQLLHDGPEAGHSERLSGAYLLIVPL